MSLGCDPAEADPCGAQLPTIIYEQSADGGLTFDGLASNCTHAMNPKRVARATELLDEYLANDCSYWPVPRCTSPRNVCGIVEVDGGLTCD